MSRAEIIANLEAEQSVVGLLLFKNQFAEMFADLKPEHFYEPAHALLWEEAIKQIEQGSGADLLSVHEKVGHFGAVQALGGRAYLGDLIDQAYEHNARTHADIVLNCARLRNMLSVVDSLRERTTPGADAFELIAEGERTFGHMVQEAAPAATNLIDARSSFDQTIAELRREVEYGREKGAMTGLRCIDRRLRGLRPGWLVVIAGRPSMGKTSLGRAAALGAARRTKAQVVFFALEMARRELDERTASQLTYEDGDGIAYQDMGAKLTMDDVDRIERLRERVPPNFIIDDSPILSVDYVRRRVLALKRRGPVAAVFIDYLQIMERPEARGRNDAAVIGEMTKGLKQLAREAEVCVVLLSQINRGVESRDDKRPQLSDLRESGAIEQDANAVLFPFRAFYYEERAEPTDPKKRGDWEMRCEELRRQMDVIAAKVRQGAVGTDHQVYFAEFDVVQDREEDRL